MTELDSRRIAFVPFKDSTNAYIARMQRLLANFGSIEQVMPLKKAFFAIFTGKFNRYDILWVNFTENDLLNTQGYLSLFNLVKVFGKTAILIALSKKTVFVRHNNYPHGTHHNRVALLILLVNVYERMFDVVVTHSGAEVQRHKMYCPHPLYTVVEDENNANSNVLANLPEEYFIVFGRILPYKKIDALVKSFPINKTLLVAGAVGDKNYAQKLSDISQNNFIFMPGYVTEMQAQKLVNGARAVVISHSDADMVVSGTFFYAMSLGKPVFAVETKFLSWIKPRISPELLILAKDVDALCQLIDESAVNLGNLNNIDVQNHAQSIQHEFGDKTILSAISNILAGNNLARNLYKDSSKPS